MHTYSLLTEHADRSTIAPAELPLLDQFLEQQKAFQQVAAAADRGGFRRSRRAENRKRDSRSFPPAAGDRQSFAAHLRGFSRARRTCCIRLPLRDGGHARVEVRSAGSRHFVLDPYPFAEPSLTFHVSRRATCGQVFLVGGGVAEAVRSAAPSRNALGNRAARRRPPKLAQRVNSGNAATICDIRHNGKRRTEALGDGSVRRPFAR